MEQVLEGVGLSAVAEGGEVGRQPAVVQLHQAVEAVPST